MFDYLFDSNSVRDFSRRVKTDAEWDAIRTAWIKKRLKSAWIPWTIGELIGTNLAGEKQKATDADCVEVALAVRRFDRIADRDILIGPRSLVKWSVNRYLGLLHGEPFEELHRKSLEAAKTLTSMSQVSVQKSQYQEVVYIRDPKTGLQQGQTIPSGFVADLDYRVGEWRKRMQAAGLQTEYGKTDIVPKEPLLKFLWKETRKNIILISKQTGLADRVVLGFEGKLNEALLAQPFVYGTVAQDWYYILRVVSVKTGKALETVGRDLNIAYYFPLAKTFVTTDEPFTKLVQGILPASIVTFEEFREQLLSS